MSSVKSRVNCPNPTGKQQSLIQPHQVVLLPTPNQTARIQQRLGTPFTGTLQWPFGSDWQTTYSNLRACVVVFNFTDLLSVVATSWNGPIYCAIITVCNRGKYLIILLIGESLTQQDVICVGSFIHLNHISLPHSLYVCVCLSPPQSFSNSQQLFWLLWKCYDETDIQLAGVTNWQRMLKGNTILSDV